MKFTLTFKTPDVLDQIEQQISYEDEVQEEATKFARKFMEFSEYIRVEFDTQKGTATVLPCKD